MISFLACSGSVSTIAFSAADNAFLFTILSNIILPALPSPYNATSAAAPIASPCPTRLAICSLLSPRCTPCKASSAAPAGAPSAAFLPMFSAILPALFMATFEATFSAPSLTALGNSLPIKLPTLLVPFSAAFHRLPPSPNGAV